MRGRRRQPLDVVTEAEAQPGRGLVGDHYSPGSKGLRQVTLVQAEHLPVVAALCGLGPLDPGLVRRNLVVSGVNLAALAGMRFRVGAVLLEGIGPCHPCSRMEEVLGPGGYNAMRGHGGLTAKIIEGGVLHLGDPVLVEGPVSGSDLKPNEGPS